MLCSSTASGADKRLLSRPPSRPTSRDGFVRDLRHRGGGQRGQQHDCAHCERAGADFWGRRVTGHGFSLHTFIESAVCDPLPGHSNNEAQAQAPAEEAEGLGRWRSHHEASP